MATKPQNQSFEVWESTVSQQDLLQIKTTGGTVLSWIDSTGTGQGNLFSSGNIHVDGTAVSNPNFQDSATVTFSVSGSNIQATALGTTAPFAGITSGTNTTAAMLVGSGASLDVSGSGTINATTLGGNTFASPSSIGSGSPNSGVFTTLQANTSLVINGGTAITAQSGTGGTIAMTASPTFTGTVSTPAISINSGTSITSQSGTGGTVVMTASPTMTGTVSAAALSLSGNLTTNVTGSTQCLHVNSVGLITGTGSDCLASSASVAFSAITSATNTQAAMVVGTGSSIGFAGSGTINASSLGGATFASPGAIGSSTPAAGMFTTLTVTSNILPNASGTLNIGSVAAQFNALFIKTITLNGGTSITGQSGTGGTLAMTVSPTFTGTLTTAALTASGTITTGITGSTQCLHVNSSGVISGTGIDCGSGGGSSAFSAITSGTNTTAAMLVGSGASLNVTGSGTINATTLGGATFASPGAIGSTSSSTGVFTTLTANLLGSTLLPSSVAVNLGSAAAPFGVIYATDFIVPGSNSAVIQGTESTPAPAVTVGTDILWLGDSVSHTAQISNNGTSFQPITLWDTTSPTSHGVVIAGTFPQQHATAVGTSGQVLTSNGAGNDPTWQNTGASSSALSAITAGIGANSIASGNNAQTWQWDLTGASTVGMTFSESTASSGGTAKVQALGNFVTSSGSTATPLIITNSLSGSQTLPALYVNPTWNTTGVVDAAVLVNVTNTASGAASLLLDLQVGGVSKASVDKTGVLTVASCSGCSSPLAISNLLAATGTNTIASGNNAQVWQWKLTGASTIGMAFAETTASTGGTAVTQALTEFSTLGGSTATPVIINNSLTGSQTLPALYVNPTWNTSGVVDAAVLVNVTNTASGTGSLLLDLQVGSSSVASVDKVGNLTLTGSTAGYVALGQGSDNSNATTSVLLEAPASVTSYRLQLPGAAPSHNNSAMLFSNAAPGVGAFAKMPQVAILTSQYTNSTTGFTNVTGGNSLAFSVEASTNYVMTCTLYYQAASTGGLNIEFTGPASPTSITYGLLDPGTATTLVAASVATSYSTSLGAVVGTASTNFPATVTVGLVNGTNAGTLQMLAKSSASVQLQIQAGSFCVMQ